MNAIHRLRGPLLAHSTLGPAIPRSVVVWPTADDAPAPFSHVAMMSTQPPELSGVLRPHLETTGPVKGQTSETVDTRPTHRDARGGGNTTMTAILKSDFDIDPEPRWCSSLVGHKFDTTIADHAEESRAIRESESNCVDDSIENVGRLRSDGSMTEVRFRCRTLER